MGKHEFFSGKRIKRAAKAGKDKGQRKYRLQAWAIQREADSHVVSTKFVSANR